jgi:CheY-like chemotaxis protein
MIERSNTSLSPIVLVEDDENDIVLLSRAFHQAQVEHPLLIARNGEEAIGLLTSRSGSPANNHIWLPILLVSDLKMPKMDGFEFLIWLQTQPQLRPVPKLMLSSSVLEEDLKRSLELGATAYFAKPNNYADLVQLVRKWKQLYLETAPRT